MIIKICMNMDILQTNEYYGEHLKIHFNKFGIKNESVNKKTLLNILYQIHYDQLEIQTKNQIETFFESRYPFFKKMKDEDMIHLTILILLKKNLKTSHITSQFESSFCIFIPYSKTNKWVLSTIFLNDNTMKFLKNQEFKFYLKRDSDYEQTRNWIKIYRHFYFDELSSIDQSQVLLFSSIMLYFIGHRNAKDLDVMAHNLSEEGLLKIQDLHERYAKKDSIEEQKKTPFYLKNKSEFMDLSIKNTEFWPNYWDEWLNRWARESNAKYFEEVLGNGEYHSYFLGMKTVTMEMEEPGCLNSGERARLALPGARAKETRVGGTSRSLKEPDIESLPPMAARRRWCWAWNAPNRAAKGSPQRLGSVPSLGKYSWRVSRMSERRAPEATALQTDSVTA